ncbi:MAG: hypothetical protein AAGM22_22530 [Acidobacteriota bacterium]
MDILKDPRFMALFQQVIADREVRQEIMQKGVNAYLAERGVDISPVKVSLIPSADAGALTIKVENSGKSFKGSFTLDVS